MATPPPASSACFLILPLSLPASPSLRVVGTSRRPEGNPFVALLRDRCNCHYLSSSKVPLGFAAGLVHDPSFWSTLHTGSCSGCVGRRGYYVLRSFRGEREEHQRRGGTTKHGRLRGLAGRVLVLLERLGGLSRNSARGTYQYHAKFGTMIVELYYHMMHCAVRRGEMNVFYHRCRTIVALLLYCAVVLALL